MITKQIPLILIFFLFAFFIFGFYVDENSAGAGLYSGDLIHIWKNQKTFNNYTLQEALNFTAVYDPQHYQSSKMPLSYILNKFLNPFAVTIEGLRKSVFFISCFVPFFLYLTLKNKYSEIDKPLIGLISSFIFLSPYFRTTGYWGLEENYGILAITLSYYFFYNLMSVNENIKKNILTIFFLTLFSSTCVYFDQKLVIIPLICFLSIIFSKKHFNLKILTSFFFIIFALPCFYIIYLWGSVLPASDSIHRNIGVIHPEHIAYTITIIAFYLLPLIFLKKEKIETIFKNFFLSKFNLSLIAVLSLYIIYLIFFSKLVLPVLGGGVIPKLSLMLFDDRVIQNIFLLFFTVCSFLVILTFLNKNFHDFLIIFFFIILSIIIDPIYQEYFDPLIVLLALTFFKTKLVINFRNVIIVLSYYSLFLFVGNVYYA
tara:strand:+ start:665 stop:1948 length:1284 start_codon:yes stop_codon:yes gene_type:complete